MPLDDRILRVSIEVNGFIRSYQNLFIRASGEKFAGPNQGTCEVQIANLSEDVATSILTETRPFNNNPNPKTIIVEAGRVSTGSSIVYIGNVFRSSQTQPPDQILTIKTLTQQFQKGNIIANSLPGMTRLSTIASTVANSLGIDLVFEAEDKNIANYNYNGSAERQIEKLELLSNIDVFIDNNTLFVKQCDRPLNGRLRVITPNEIIGKPELSDRGLKISFFYDSQTVVGGMLDVTSNQYPTVSGRYIIYKLSYDLANRETPFYYTAEAVPML